MKEIKEIKAREGYYLTQVEEVGENRIFITAIKGVNINESDWREATQEEKDEFENTQKEREEEKLSFFNKE